MKLILGSRLAISSSSSRGINQSLREQFLFAEHPNDTKIGALLGVLQPGTWIDALYMSNTPKS
jgi:hypothetical protein